MCLTNTNNDTLSDFTLDNGKIFEKNKCIY